MVGHELEEGLVSMNRRHGLPNKSRRDFNVAAARDLVPLGGQAAAAFQHRKRVWSRLRLGQLVIASVHTNTSCKSSSINRLNTTDDL